MFQSVKILNFQSYAVSAIFIFLSPLTALLAHHPSAGPGSRVLGASTPVPRDQLIFALDYLKGDPENRDIWTLTAAGELNFFDGRVGLGLQLPYQYYEQKDRADAARYARPRLGLRLQPWPELSAGEGQVFLVGDVDVGFATGSDRNRFVDENFYDSAAGLTLGCAFDDLILTIRGGGVFPLSRLPQAETDDPDGVVHYPWEPVAETNTRDTHELKKVTEWRLRAGYRVTEVLQPFVGFAYRVPYAGVLKERATGDRVPKIYREFEAGLVVQASESLAVTVGYRIPLFRKREYSDVDRAWYVLQGRAPPDPSEFRQFVEAYNVSVSILF